MHQSTALVFSMYFLGKSPHTLEYLWAVAVLRKPPNNGIQQL